MLTLERLAELMHNNVHRVDGNFPYDVEYYDGGHSDVVDEGIDVKYTDDEGNLSSVWIDKILSINKDGLIRCNDQTGGDVIEVEIFERIKSFD